MSTDGWRDPSWMFFNAPPLIAPPRKPNEALWTMTKDGRTWAAALRGHGEYGSALQLFRDGDFRYGHRHQLHEDAVTEGDHWRAKLEAKGWTAA